MTVVVLLVLSFLALMVVLGVAVNSFYVFHRTAHEFGVTAGHFALSVYLFLVVYDCYRAFNNRIGLFSLAYLVVLSILFGGPGDWLKKKLTAAKASLTAIAETAFKRDAAAC